MNVAVALFCVGLGYAIGYLRGWQRGVEATRTYIDTRSWQAGPTEEARRRREQAREELQPR